MDKGAPQGAPFFMERVAVPEDIPVPEVWETVDRPMAWRPEPSRQWHCRLRQHGWHVWCRIFYSGAGASIPRRLCRLWPAVPFLHRNGRSGLRECCPSAHSKGSAGSDCGCGCRGRQGKSAGHSGGNVALKSLKILIQGKCLYRRTNKTCFQMKAFRESG